MVIELNNDDLTFAFQHLTLTRVYWQSCTIESIANARPKSVLFPTEQNVDFAKNNKHHILGAVV